MITRTHRQHGWLLVLALALGGCAVPPAKEGGSPGRCVELVRAVDRGVAAAGVHDAQAARIAGFPYLRVDRFLASFADAPLEGEAFAAWTARLRALDRVARAKELANLPPAARRRLAAQVPASRDLRTVVAECTARLYRAGLDDPAARRRLRAQARVPDEYRTSWRVLGLYPITRWFVAMGVDDWHEQAHATFDTPREALPVAGRLMRYIPRGNASLAPATVAALVAGSADNPLGVPEPRGRVRERLLEAFAPVWEVDVAGDADRIGRPAWSAREASAPRVDTADSVVFRRLSHTRWRGDILLQLNYVVWFPSRPRTGVFDLLGGHLDGVTWRVTLDRDGGVLAYDAIHNCGCYHMWFPAPSLRRAEPAPPEPPLIPQRAPRGEGRVVIRLAHRTHQIQRVYRDRAPHRGQPLAAVDYERLRSLPAGDGARRSLFGPDGVVAGTERAERWLLWPTGVPAPGAMRQWGHHAVAFVGRRHFDDPDIVSRLFVAPAQGASR